MQLGKFTDFGLRVMLHLAVVYPQKLSVQKIAKTFDLSDHHLAKVCSTLVKAGLIRSERGRNGGGKAFKSAQRHHFGRDNARANQDHCLSRVRQCFWMFMFDTSCMRALPTP